MIAPVYLSALVVGAWPFFDSIMFNRTDKVDWRKMQRGFAVTVTEIRPFRNGWQVMRAPVCRLCFLESGAMEVSEIAQTVRQKAAGRNDEGSFFA
jgi:hypothetical protein